MRKTSRYRKTGAAAPVVSQLAQGPAARSGLGRLFALCAACLFLLPASAGVMPPVDLPSAGEVRYAKEAARIYRLAENQARFLLSRLHAWHGDGRYKLLTDSRGTEEHIVRPNTSAVATFAFLCRYGPYSEENTGIGRRELLDTCVIPMLRYLAAVHTTGGKTFDDGAKWGLSWQSALWATQFGQAVWMLWDELPEELRAAALKLVTAEADRVAGREPPFRREFDSKSEENAWDATVLSTALLLMPGSPSRDVWEESLIKWQMSSYAAPSDAFCERIADGKSVKSYFLGANIHDDYTLENHGIAHPDYMCASTMNLEVALDYLMTGRKPLDASLHNCDRIYAQLKYLLLPGAQLVYPSGQDWALFRGVDYVDLHAFHLLYFRDPAALHWLRECIATAEKMQLRHTSGAVYAPEENFFPSAQAHLGYYLSMAWRALMWADAPEGRFGGVRGAKHFPDGKFFVRRTGRAVHTVSWGRKLMIQALADAADPIVGPDWHNGIGTVRLKGSAKPLPVRLADFGVEGKKGAGTCRFRFIVMHGDAVKAEIAVESRPDGSLTVEERLTALKRITTEEIATLSLGILNHPAWIYEKGERRLENAGVETPIPALSGKSVALRGKSLSVDRRLRITCREEIAGSYAGARKWAGSKVIDKIILNHRKGSEQWEPGSVISFQSATISFRGSQKR